VVFPTGGCAAATGIAREVASISDPPTITRSDFPDEPVPLESLSIQFMRRACFVPLSLDEGVLRIAMADPGDAETLEALEMAFDHRIAPCRGGREDILERIEHLYGTGRQTIETIIEEADRDISKTIAEIEEDAEQLRDMASEAPIIRLVNRLIRNAVELQASDIHFEPFEDVFKVRYRIDGVLSEVESPPKRFQSAVISRVKIMARLDISERRLPQDGRIKLRVANREIDFRVSTIPTLYGESVVMRILDQETLVLDLKKLGFADDLLQSYLELIARPHGMILVTGPTGSGKTSTLYATLSLLNSPEKKIITLEDPVEYQLRGVNQIHIHSKIGLTFAKGLRAIVRQDPDIILVGEIRDRETAETAVQSALTGHLLFSTLHTNDAPGAVTRLLDMGVESFLLSSTLLGALAQRLVRVVCPACRKAHSPAPGLIASMGASPEDIDGRSVFQAAGCEACRQTGYRGRTALFEYLAVDEDIRREISRKASTEEIRAAARRRGMVSLRRDGWRKVLQGETTIDEVLKVTLDS